MILPWQNKLKQALDILNDLWVMGDGDKFGGYRTPEDKAARLEAAEKILAEVRKSFG